MLFLGNYDHSIDAKQRLAIPAPFRQQWNPDVDGTAWIATPWLNEKVIRLYTEGYFRTRAANYERSLTPDPDEAQLNAILFGVSARVEMDTAGRVRLPQEMLEVVGLGSEVTLVGAGDWLEIRDRGRWQKEEKLKGLEQLPELLARIQAKRNSG
ncbi:MAG: hypothetical protein VYC34_11370 [Planctomycetota bacterium]|nr:hypothetical protein [Planctomycetota bacterium]